MIPKNNIYFLFLKDTAMENLRIRPKVLPPKIEIISTTEKTETCSRHVDQLLVRGEQVALVAVLSKQPGEELKKV